MIAFGYLGCWLCFLLVRKICGLDVHTWGIADGRSAKYIDQVIKEYFEGRTNLLHVRVEFEFSNTWENEIIDHLTLMLCNSTQMAYIVNIQNEDEAANIYYDYNIWYVDSLHAFRNILPNMTSYQGNAAGYYVVLMHLAYDAWNYEEVVQLALEDMLEVNIINVNIIVTKATGDTVLYSYEPFQQGACGTVKAKVVNTFFNGKFSNDELFPVKLRNFHRCEITFLSRNVAPFFTFDMRLSNASKIPVHGIEGEMIKTMAKHLNFRAMLTVVPAQTWGDVYENGSVTGPFELLVERKVDVLMGYFTYEPRRILRFGESIPYIMSPLVAVVNRKSELDEFNPNWPLDSLKSSTWKCMLVFIIVVIVLMRLANSLGSVRQMTQFIRSPTWLDVVGMSIGIALPVIHSRRMVIRFFLATWLIGFMICSAAYQGQLFMVYNRVEPPRTFTLNDYRQSNYTFLVRHTFEMSHLIDHDLGLTMDRIVRIYTNDANVIYERMLNFTGNVSTLATKLRILHYVIAGGYYDKLNILPIILRMRQICAYFRPQSLLIEPFNSLIGALLGNGLIAKWYTDAEYELQKKEAEWLDSYLSQEPQPLGMKVFSTVFIGLGVCLVFSFVVFLIEIIWYKYENRVRNRCKLMQSIFN